MKRLLSLFALISVIFSATAFAQLEVGASYEFRNEEPQSGFGLRIQKGFLDRLPMIDAGLRGHFSYFSEGNEVTKEGNTYSEVTNYDFGLAAYGGVSLGLMQPYVGLGLGSEKAAFNRVRESNVEESNIFWNTFVGAKVTVIPLVKPFLEYRYSNKELGDPTLADSQDGRIIIGVSLSF